jgi:hypothetical protein
MSLVCFVCEAACGVWVLLDYEYITEREKEGVDQVG